MVKILIIFILASINCFGQLSEQVEDSCKIENFEKLNTKELNSLFLGKWEYQYSFVDDTCFYLANLGDLPISFSFEETDVEKMKFKYPKLYSFGDGKLLFGLVCWHDKKSFEKKTYPLVNLMAKDSSIAMVTHYIEGNGVGKIYSYFLESVNQEELVIQNERYYNLGIKKVVGVHHVYTKQKE